jgi:carbon monoxide dehydrogenase subunit G
MELHAPIPFPPAVDAADDAALAEIDVAIALVASGVANRVRVSNIPDDTAEHVAGVGAARAGTAGVRFVVERSSLSRTLTIGPRVR